MYMNEGMDTGDMILKEEVQIGKMKLLESFGKD